MFFGAQLDCAYRVAAKVTGDDPPKGKGSIGRIASLPEGIRRKQ
jgi:hypothetical protein